MSVMRVAVALMMSLVALSGCASQTEPAPDDVVDPVVAAIEAAVPGGSQPVFPGEYNFSLPYSQVLSPGNLSILPPQRIDIPSEQDGVNIEMALWLPDGDGPFPVMLFSSPYFYAEGSQGGGRTVDAPGGSVQILIDNLVPHGYAFATHAVRGTAGSDGCNDLMGPKETLDIDQAVTWLGTQDWSNGNVAMTGVSYDGSTPWGVASLGNPHLKTIVPISGVPDMHGLMYRNGSSETRGPLVLNALYIQGGIASGTNDNIAERTACPEAYEGLGLSGVAALTGYDATGYWQERNRKPGVEANYQGSVFSIQGLQDWNVDPSQVIPWVEQLDRSGIKTKQLLGQWGHSWPDGFVGEDQQERWENLYRADWKEILLRWLDSELKGLDVETGPAVQVMDDLGRWRSEAHFPPRDTNWTRYVLSDNGYMVESDPVAGERVLLPNLFGTTQLPAGQIPVENADIAADFRLGPFEDDLLVVGLPKVHVTVVPQAAGGYMAAFLYEQDGDEMRRLGWTSMNLLYAAGGTDPEPVVPGMPLKVNMEIQPMDGVVQAGKTLVLRLWVFTDGDRLPTIPPGSVNLIVGDESEVYLPTVERDEAYYFEAPHP